MEDSFFSYFRAEFKQQMHIISLEVRHCFWYNSTYFTLETHLQELRKTSYFAEKISLYKK